MVYAAPGVPLTCGLRTLLKTIVSAAAACEVPPLRVMVTVEPLIAAARAPSIVADVAAVAAPLLKAKVAGNPTAIFPSAGIGLVVVKEMVTLPLAPAVKDAGWTFAALNAPAVIVSAATARSWSIVSSAPVCVFT